MNKSGRYAFALLALGCVIAGMILLLKEFAGRDEVHYVLPCGLIAIGLVLGFFALCMNSDSDDPLSGSLTGDSDEPDDASRSKDKGEGN